MLRNIVLMSIVNVVFAMSGCMGVTTPAIGLIYTEVKYGDMATGEVGANREGKACATSILAMIATGDASVAAAKANGGITQVSSVDHSAKSTLGIIGEWCTIVKGK
jgi:hypothetical protein